MHDPGDFAGRPKPRDHIAVAVNDFGLRVDDDAAHCVVALHRDDAGVERRFNDLIDEHRLRTAERILFGVNGLVVSVDSVFQHLGIDGKFLR